MTKKIRQAIRQGVKDGISPTSILFSVGRLVTPEEAEYLKTYEKGVKVGQSNMKEQIDGLESVKLLAGKVEGKNDWIRKSEVLKLLKQNES